MSTVNKERVALLVAALRSGEFQQVSGTLGRETTRINDAGEVEKHVAFCCLGVACEVAIKNGLEIDKGSQFAGHRENGDETHELYYDGERAFLPIPVMDWYGFSGRDPVVITSFREEDDPTGTPAHEETAASLNDQYRYEFPAIADAFENFFIKEQ